MNNPAQCQLCGGVFYPDQHWKTLCIPCFKISKAKEGAELPELAALRAENAQLRLQLIPTPVAVIPPEIVQQLIRLAHPDKHGNSPSSNEATAWLLVQRGRA